MKVEVWSDVTCPWCGIGFHRLRTALGQFEHRDSVEVVRRSFQLVPHAPEGTWTVREHMAARYGLTPEQVQANIEQVESTAVAEGIAPYELGDNVVGSTALTHEFLAFARSQGVGEAAWALIFDTYFGQARPVFALNDLVGLARAIDLDPERTRTVLAERRFEFNVASDVHALRSKGVEGVPFHLFAGRYALPGTDRVEVLVNALELAWQHHTADLVLVDGGGSSCGPASCD